MTPDHASIFDLSPSEKLQLVEDLWDDLAATPEAVPIYDWQKEELARRKANLLRKSSSRVISLGSLLVTMLINCGCSTRPAPVHARESRPLPEQAVPSFDERITLRATFGPVIAVAFSPDSKIVVAATPSIGLGTVHGLVKLWNVSTGEELGRLRHDKEVNAIAFAPDGKTLACGSRDGTVRLWDLATRKEVASFRGGQGAINSVAYAPNGETVASGGHDHTVRVWDVAKGEQRYCLRGHTAGVWTVAYSPDGRMLASAGFDKTVRLWDAVKGGGRAALAGHRQSVYSLAFTPDGKTLLSGSFDGMVMRWDVANDRQLLPYPRLSFALESLALAPTGKMLAVVGEGLDDKRPTGVIELLDYATGRRLASLGGHRRLVHCVAFSPDGRRMATGSWDGTVKVAVLSVRRGTGRHRVG